MIFFVGNPVVVYRGILNFIPDDKHSKGVCHLINKYIPD